MSLHARLLFKLAASAAFSTPFALVACGIQPSIGTDVGASSTSSPSATTTRTGAAAATGIDCRTDPSSGATLCLGISSCPSFLIDGDAFPSCGFRVNGAVLDLECLCDNLLCPIGVATTCAQVTQLLANQTSLQVCQQVNDGRCTAASTKADAGTSSSSSSSCDRDCQSQCAGAPGCLQLCGC